MKHGALPFSAAAGSRLGKDKLQAMRARLVPAGGSSSTPSARFRQRAATDQQAYTLAKRFLLRVNKPDVTEAMLQEYLAAPTVAQRPKTLAGIFQSLLESAQNANMKAGVVGKSIGGVQRLGPLLSACRPASVAQKYQGDWERLPDDIVRVVRPRGVIRRTRRSIWPHYCQTILSGAQFLEQFNSAEEFYDWLNFFDGDPRARIALPALLTIRIRGLGFALACDFIKELGYANFAKPDVHVRDIFQALHLCPTPASDYEVFDAIARVAGNVGVTPYDVDKVFWLIGSGNFYKHTHIGNNGRVRGRKAEFIAYSRARMPH